MWPVCRLANRLFWNDYYGAINKGVGAKNYESDSGAKKRT